MTIDTGNHMPAIGLETLGSIICKPSLNVSINGDTVVVPESDQFAKPQRTSQRAGFMRDTFHQAAITQKDKGIVIDDVMAITIEFCRQRTFSDCHTDTIGNALTQRTSGGFHAW